MIERMKLYGNRNPEKLEPHYSNHVDAMTREGLHGKAEIAEEMAWRDQQNEKLEAENGKLRNKLQTRGTNLLVLRGENSTLRSRIGAMLDGTGGDCGDCKYWEKMPLSGTCNKVITRGKMQHSHKRGGVWYSEDGCKYWEE